MEGRMPGCQPAAVVFQDPRLLRLQLRSGDSAPLEERFAEGSSREPQTLAHEFCVDRGFERAVSVRREDMLLHRGDYTYYDGTVHAPYTTPIVIEGSRMRLYSEITCANHWRRRP
jgi:hypothetical protein